MRLPPLTASRAPRGLRHAVALALLAGSGAPLWSTGAAAQDAISADAEFTVADLKVEGLQRIAEGTVFNYLPVAIGDRLTRAKTDEALRALYATGFFRNVELRREGDALVVVVQERPSIESFTIDGNEDGVGNNQNMIAMSDLAKKQIAGGKTLANNYLDQVNDVGNLAQQAKITQQALTVVKDQAVQSRDKISGVNLDDEAAELIRFQQAYQASAKALQVSSQLFDAILQVR